MTTAASIQRLGLRLISKAGSLPVMAHPALRARVGKVLHRSAHVGGAAQIAVGRAFAARKASRVDPARTSPTTRRGVFDLTPTEDQQMLREAARGLGEDVIRPAAAQADTDRTIPADVTRAAADLGLVLLGVPAELDGIAEDGSAVTGALVLEELARGDMGIAVGIMATASVATALSLYGTADQQSTYLPHFTGTEPVKAAALAIQEPQPLFDALSPRTTGVTGTGGITLNGVKALVPTADSAELFIVSALVDGAPRLVIVEANTPGITIEDDPAMGIRAAHTGRLLLTDVTVPTANLLGSTEDHLDAIRRSRLAWAAAACGTAQAVLDQVIPYTKERHAFGEPIAHRQAVAFHIADIAIELEGLRLVTWQAAARLDAGQDASEPIALARALTSAHATQIGSHGVQLLGGHGFVKEFDNERWYRDLRGAGVLEGVLLI